jgi:hypothetical protein
MVGTGGIDRVSQNNRLGAYAGLLVAGGVVAWFGFVRDSDWLVRDRASTWYGVPDSRIEVDEGKTPHDCDFITAPLGEKHCVYTREYLATWYKLGEHGPIQYGNTQEAAPTDCSVIETDFAHRCYLIDDLKPDEHPTADWHARRVFIRRQKVEQ